MSQSFYQPSFFKRLIEKSHCFLPKWLKNYQSTHLMADIIAGLVVGILVIPQSLGYAVLAGLPPIYGLYTAIIPVIVYAWVGSSNIQAVGPVAITAIMTANALEPYANSEAYLSLVTLLALMVGGILWLAGLLRLGWIMQFISRGVSAGFVSGASILIFLSQIKYLTGSHFSGKTLIEYLNGIIISLPAWHQLTCYIGFTAFGLLLINRYASQWLLSHWISTTYQVWIKRLVPLGLVIIAIILSHLFQWQQLGVATIGHIPKGLPHFSPPTILQFSDIIALLPSAGLMALIAFVSSSSVASRCARIRNETFVPNQELIGLGLANMAGGFFQSFPVAGGFSRTAINLDSGACSPMASMVTVVVMVATLLFLADIIAPLPYALLGATIMTSVISLIDWQTLKKAYRFDRLDALSFLATFASVLVFGLNIGLVIGLLVSFATLIWQSSQPHIAVVGLLDGSEHFRNIHRYKVKTFENLLIMRIDESLFFGNSQSVYQQVIQLANDYPNAQELILIMSAVNHIDLTAQEMLAELNQEVMAQNKRLHFCVIKGPVMDAIKHTPIIQNLSGQIFLDTISAVRSLAQDDVSP